MNFVSKIKFRIIFANRYPRAISFSTWRVIFLPSTLSIRRRVSKNSPETECINVNEKKKKKNRGPRSLSLCGYYTWLFVLAWSWCVAAVGKTLKINTLSLESVHFFSRAKYRSVNRWSLIVVIVVAWLVVAFRRIRDSSHGTRSRDSGAPAPARHGSTYPRAIVRTLQQTKKKKQTHTLHCISP